MKLNPAICFQLLLFFILTISCTSVKRISDYDEITDQTLTSLQQTVSGYFVQMERNVNTPKAHMMLYDQFFDDAKVKLNTLEIRTAALDNNQHVYEQVIELQEMIRNLEKLHQIGFKSAEEIRELQKPFNQAFTSILKLQLALRRTE